MKRMPDGLSHDEMIQHVMYNDGQGELKPKKRRKENLDRVLANAVKDPVKRKREPILGHRVKRPKIKRSK